VNGIIPSGLNDALLLWSGGADSTALLLLLLERRCRVRTLTVVHPQVNAAAEQRAARERAKARLSKLGYGFDSLEVELAHKSAATDAPPPFDAEPTGEDGGVLQPVIWLTAAVTYLRRTEDLYTAWIKSDCAIHYLPHLRAAFDSLKAVANRKGNLLVPMEWASKAQVIQKLKTAGLLSCVWWCENPQAGKKGKPCGKCSPCMTHATGRWQLESGNALYL
jgi:7-cyano-7-deazaguanine synthase in queuosine biosynthesis